MKLSEVIKKIRAEKKLTQAELAASIGVESQEVQRAENAGRNQEKLWTLIVGLLPYCTELDIITEQDLLHHRGHGHKTNSSSDKASKAKANRG